MMMPTFMVFSIVCISYMALGCMALAMFSNFKDTFKKPPTLLQSRCLYWSGWALLILSYFLSIDKQGIAYGSIFFTGVLAVVGLLVILTLSYRATSLPVLMASGLVASTGYFLS